MLTQCYYFGYQCAKTSPVNSHKNCQRKGRSPVVENVTWIADELLGIRTLEQRLSKKLSSQNPQNSRFLLNSIQDLNIRIELLDQALDQCISPARRPEVLLPLD
jgi:hypothetical protein